MESFKIFDKKYTGGLDGAKGYQFEDNYVLSQLPTWLQSEDLRVLQQELLTDLELFDSSGLRRFIQIKNHRITPSEFREVVSDFHNRELSGVGKYEKYVIASAGLSQDIDNLARKLEKFRSANNYSKEELEESRRDILAKLEKLGFEEQIKDFVIQKVHFESKLEWIADATVLQNSFVGGIVRAYGLKPETADNIYSLIARLIVEERGKPIPLDSFRTEIEQKAFQDKEHLLSEFDIVTQEFLQRHEETDNQTFFFEGSVPTWSDIVHNCDISRDVSAKIIAAVEQWNDGKLAIPILAQGGEGKSTLSMRLAAELSTKDKTVLYLKRDVLTINAQEIENASKRVNDCVYIFVDDVARIQNFEGFIQRLTELRFPVVLIVTARSYEWPPLRPLLQSASLQVGMNGNQEITLDPLSDNEMQLLFKLLPNINRIPKLSDEEVRLAIEHYTDRSSRILLLLNLELTKGDKANAVIRKEVERVRKLDDSIFTAYKYICLMSSLGSYLPLSLLRQLVTGDDIELDLNRRLYGLVEISGSNIYARHARIGEIATQIIFEDADDSLATALIRIIDLAFSNDEMEVLTSIAKSLQDKLPESYVSNVLNDFIDRAFCEGKNELIKRVFPNNVVSGKSFLGLLVAKTPLIIEHLVLPSFVGRITWTENPPTKFLIPPCLSEMSYSAETEKPTFECCSKWVEIYADSCRWGEPITSDTKEFFVRVVDFAYSNLVYEFPDNVVDLKIKHADFLADYFHVRDIDPELFAKKSRMLYESILEQEPENAEAHVGLALHYYINYRYEIGSMQECYIKALYHSRMVLKLNKNLVFSLGHEDIFFEFLEHLGAWNELIELRKESLARHKMTRQNFEKSDFFKKIFVAQRIEANSDTDWLKEHIFSNYDDTEVVDPSTFDRLLDHASKLPLDKQIELGKIIFRDWFGKYHEILALASETENLSILD